MPHIIVKLWPGRSETQKKDLTERIVQAVVDSIQVEETSVSVAIEEVPSEEWTQRVFKPDIIDKEDTLYKKPGYKPVE